MNKIIPIREYTDPTERTLTAIDLIPTEALTVQRKREETKKVLETTRAQERATSSTLGYLATGDQRPPPPLKTLSLELAGLDCFATDMNHTYEAIGKKTISLLPHLQFLARSAASAPPAPATPSRMALKAAERVEELFSSQDDYEEWTPAFRARLAQIVDEVNAVWGERS